MVVAASIAGGSLIAALALAPMLASTRGDAPVDFAREVQPLLSDRCFACHGPDEAARKAGLRLDTRDGALATLRSGNTAVVPGDVAASELIVRIAAEHSRKRMPPTNSGKELSEAERATLTRWIEQGAKWAGHWAWQPPTAAPLPEVRDAAWCREPLDRFVLARLEQEGLAPSPEADPLTLLRRVTLALTGLPPTLEEVDAFVAEIESERESEQRAALTGGTPPRPDAYDRAVERLLASPHYGERLALPWLDAARYADSNGFQQDGDTHQWVWRDWLVRALNDDVPQDRLATLLLAGDLLPAATPAQRLEQQVASGLQRCAMLNGEGGAIAEEQRNVLLFDRVDLFATTFLGLTAACAQCHDHKYDPLTQRDYYALFAFWNRVPESGVPPGGGQYRIAEPWVRAGTAEQMEQLAALEAAASEAERALAQALDDPQLLRAQAEWEAARRADAAAIELAPWEASAPVEAANFDAAYAIDATDASADEAASWVARPELQDGVVHALAGDNRAFFFRRTLRLATPRTLSLRFGSDDALRVRVDGHVVLERKVSRAAAPDQEQVDVALDAGAHELRLQIVNGGGPGGFWFEARVDGLPLQLAAALATEPAAREPAVAKQLHERFLAAAAPPALAAAQADRAAALARRDALRDALPQVMVMSDAQPRTTHVLARGNYEMPLEEVVAAPPAFLPPLPADAPRDRLGLARWLVAPENPLFARVLANRAWQHFFATGLAKTSENLGLQGEAASHPELLDSLAVELRTTHGWSMKALHRSLVRSATFRQSSRTTGPRGEQLRARDPENRLLARGPRQRLPAMVLRDVALAASGLLVPTIGGKPVYPFQPADIWSGLAITKERDFAYPQSSGDDLWRRSLYTFWRRTVAPGNMFDASPRQSCKVRLPVTSTPLQALTLLNDPTWVAAAGALAERAIEAVASEGTVRDGTVRDGAALEDVALDAAALDRALAVAFRRVVARAPTVEEIATLRGTVARARASFERDPTAATALLGGVSIRERSAADHRTLDHNLDHAALAVACLVLFNLDEAQTCE